MSSSSRVPLLDPEDRRDGRRLPRDRRKPQLYKQLNERLNDSIQRGTKNSFTGQVSTRRFEVNGAFCDTFAYRDTAEMNLGRYLEACPGVRSWGRRTSPVTWMGASGVYQTRFPIEVWRSDGVQLIAIVGDDIIEHEYWGMFALEMAHGHVWFINQSDLFGSRAINPESITLDFVGQQPWSSVMPKATVDLLLQHRSTNEPEVTAAIVQVAEAAANWMSVQEIVDAVGHQWAYAQVMQMIWSERLWRAPQDAEKPLGMATRVGLVRTKQP